jgi:multimeric flavodoxin WrbA
MEEVIPRLLAADGVVLVSPIYYYNVSAQLKAVIDRFHAKGDEIHEPKKAAMLLTMEDDTQESAEGALTSFKGMTGYLGWKQVGTVAALACPNPEALQKTSYLTDAYNLGKSM